MSVSAPTLSEPHFKSLVVDSGIHPVVVQARGYATVRTPDELVVAIGSLDPLARVVTTQHGENYGDDNPNDITVHIHYGVDGNLRKGHFTPAQLRLPGLLIPTWWEGRIVGHQLRPDRPRFVIEDDKTKLIKYEQPTGLPKHLDAHPDAWRWQWIRDPKYPLVITEGEKKGDSLQTQCVPTIAITGVWNWQRDGKPLPEWSDVPLQGRSVYVAFDSDVATNEHVQKARLALTDFLRSQGARVRWLGLPSRPDGGKLGIDDWLAVPSGDDLVGDASLTHRRDRGVPGIVEPDRRQVGLSADAAEAVAVRLGSDRPAELVDHHEPGAGLVPVRLAQRQPFFELALAQRLQLGHERAVDGDGPLASPGLDRADDDLARHDRPGRLRSADEDLALVEVDSVPCQPEHLASPQPIGRQSPRHGIPILRGDGEECG
jgi:hypothetical protein